MLKHLQKVALRQPAMRLLSQTTTRPFISNFFGSKEAKQKDIISKQNEYEVDPSSQIVILDEANAPGTKPFDPLVDMPGFSVNQWKLKDVKNADIEASYSPEDVSKIINDTYTEITGSQAGAETDLLDLELRFRFSKLLQQKLGFHISDYVLTKSHTLDILASELLAIVTTRWTSERNPNAIVLRKGDFTAPNIHLNEELTEEEQLAAYNEVLEKAREATN